MFITLKEADSGAAVTLNVDRIVYMCDTPAPGTGTIIELTDAVFRVVESRALIMAELRRIRFEREDAPAVDDAAQLRKAELAAQRAIDAYADTIEADSVPAFRRRADVWRDVITDAAYTALGMD